MKTVQYDENTHKLVPLSATEAMREAAAKADDEGFEAGRSHGASSTEIYDAMLSAAPPAAPVAAVPDKADQILNAMNDVAQEHAHSLALNLECILYEYNGQWYDRALESLEKYRAAMNEIHERECPTYMGEPFIPKDQPDWIRNATPPSDGATSPAITSAGGLGLECEACLGRGAINVSGQQKPCPACHGTGTAPTAAPTAQAVGVDTPELSTLAARYAATNAGKDYMAIVAHITALVTSAHQEGREKALKEAACEVEGNFIGYRKEDAPLVEIAAAIRALASVQPGEQGEG